MPDRRIARLTRAELELAHRTRLAQLVPARLPSRSAGRRPRLILIGGQQAVGKTRLQDRLFLVLDDGSLARYDGDDNALVHPRYEALLRADPLEGHYQAIDAVLHPELHLKCLDRLRAGDHQYDVLASQPLADADRARQWVGGFTEHGYRVSVVYIAMHWANSTLGLAQRYQDPVDQQGFGRWIDLSTHDQFYELIPVTAQLLEDEGLVDDLYVVDREGNVLYENHRRDGRFERSGVGAAIVDGRARPQTQEEYEHFWYTADRLLTGRDPADLMKREVRGAVLHAMARLKDRGMPVVGSAERLMRIDECLQAGDTAWDARRLASSGLVVPRSVSNAAEPPASDVPHPPKPGSALER
ncbi:zeta toxin family protein [Kribbella sp. NPDC026611]|uniref:zeta toxin family protein n=1 Tax=Kribbella sp. NPDC026611 TaxID=3154911 RepID=UPI0033E3945E